MPESAPIASPCIGTCRIADDGLCAGCHRTLPEIAAWSQMSEQQRLCLMREVLPLRAEAKAR